MKKRIPLIISFFAVLLSVFIAGTMLSGCKQTPEETSVEASETEKPTETERETEPEPVVPAGVRHCICGSTTGAHVGGCDGQELPWTAWTEKNGLPTSSGYYYLDTDVELITSDHVADVQSSAIIYLDLNGHTIHSSTRVYRIATASVNVELGFLDTVGTGKIVMDTHPNGGTLVLLDASGDKSVTFYGGTYDGSALSAVSEEKALNGTMLRIGGGKLNVYGGTFIGGSATGAGGIAYVQNAEFNMTGGELRDGHAANGGNVMLRTATFNMNGGRITGGVAEGAANSRGGNIFSDRSEINIGKGAEVSDGSATYLGTNIFTNQPDTLSVEGEVFITGKEVNGIYPAPMEEEDENHMVCICGSSTDKHYGECDGTKYPWRPWKDSESLPSTSGKYYLDTDVQLSGTVKIQTAEDVFLDLYGHRVTSGTRIYELASAGINDSLTILDSTGTQGLVRMYGNAEGAAFAAVGNTGNKTVNIYGGVFDASSVVTSKNGAFMRLGTATCRLNIYSCTINGGRATNGGAIYVKDGHLHMEGGYIQNGSAENGGNVIIADGTLTMTGGWIRNGSATMTTGEKGRGGNIFNNGGTLKINGWSMIYDGTAVGAGPNIFSRGDYKTSVQDGCAYFSDAEGTGIYPIEAEAEDPNHMTCICGSQADTHLPGCDGTKYAWAPWKTADSLPTESGRYYLDTDVTMTAGLNITSAEEIFLDLNGHTVTSSTRVYTMASAKIADSLTILDSVGGGKVVLNTYDEGATFAAIGNTGDKKVTIYGGTFDASAITTAKNGSFMRVGSATATLELHGGEIIGGKAQNGGAIHVGGGTFIMTGGVIRDGEASNAGGNVQLAGGSFTMTGGELIAGKASGTGNPPGRGGNIFNSNGTVTVSGDAKVYDGTSVGDGPNVFSTGEYTTEITEGTCFFSEKDGDGIYPLTTEPGPDIDPADPMYRCICGSATNTHLPGCDGTKHLFTAMKADTALPTEAGTYYFAVDEDLTFDFTITLDTNSTIHLDLSGHTITSTSRIFNMAVADTIVTLTVSDSVGGGKVVMTDYTDGATFAVLGNSGKKVLTIYGGTFDTSAIDALTTSKNGAFVRASVKGASVPEVNVHGGTIIGGKAQNGGIFYVNGGVLTMTGGVVKDGEAGNAGGNVLVMGGAKLEMTGGEISGGKATGTSGRGGNIFNNGATVKISGEAKVHDGASVGDGPNLFSTGEYTVNVTAGTCFFTEAEGDGIYPPVVEPGPEPDQARCICGSQTSTHLTGCDGTKQTWTSWTTNNALPVTAGYYRLDTDVTISSTQTVTATGTTVYLDLNGHKVTSNTRIYNLATKDVAAELVISDGAGSGEVVMTAYTGGGTFAVLGNSGNKTLTIYGGTFDATAINATGGNGGFVRIARTGSFTSVINLHGGLIKSGAASNSKYAGGIYVASGCTLNVTGGEITGGTGTHGANVYATGGTVRMTGGKITNGHATAIGGNVFLIDGASLILEGGEIYGGSTDDGAGNVCVNKASMTMSGGKIYGGVSQTGGNIRVQSAGTITMTGGEIYGGSATVGSNPRGGNILNNASTVTISGAARVYDGTATNGGNNIYNIGSYTLNADDGCVFITDSDDKGIYTP